MGTKHEILSQMYGGALSAHDVIVNHFSILDSRILQ